MKEVIAPPGRCRSSLALLCLIVLGGCLPLNSSVERPDVLRIAYTKDPESLNPITSGDTTSALLQRLVYDSLAEMNMADPDELVPRLAERWTFDKAKLEYTIHLRHDAKWQPITLPSGTVLPSQPVTARDVKFTFDCIMNPDIPAEARSDFENPGATDAESRSNIEVKLVDEHTIKVRWKKPYFLSEVATLEKAIIPRHVYAVDKYGDLISLDFSSKEFAAGFNNHWANSLMCGSGPFTLVDWSRNERVVLARNPNFWGKAPAFRRIVFGAEPNNYTLLQKLLQQEIDWADLADKDLYDEAQHHPAVEAGKILLKTYEYPGYRYISYNLRRPFLADKQVRRALTQAVPIEQIIDVVFAGRATQVTGPFMFRSKAYNHDVKPLEFDLDKARKALESAGWRDSNNNGIRDKVVDGRLVEAHIDLMIEASSSQHLTIAQIIQGNWRRIGVDVDISPVQQALISMRTHNKDFDAVLRGWALSWHADPYQTWYSGGGDSFSPANIIGYQNGEVDKLVTRLRVTFDRQEQLELYHRIHQLIYEDQPYTFLFAEKQTCGYNARLQNVKFYDVRPCVDYREWRPAEKTGAGE